MESAVLVHLDRPLPTVTITKKVKISITNTKSARTVIEEWQETRRWTSSSQLMNGAPTHVA